METSFNIFWGAALAAGLILLFGVPLVPALLCGIGLTVACFGLDLFGGAE